MKDIVEQFYKDIKKSREVCPWAAEQTLSGMIAELKGEVAEVEEAIQKNDDRNLAEELGDVFWDLMFTMIIAEDEKGFDIKKIISDAHKKLIRRKPHVFGDVKIKTTEDAIKIWNAIKEKERNGDYD